MERSIKPAPLPDDFRERIYCRIRCADYGIKNAQNSTFEKSFTHVDDPHLYCFIVLVLFYCFQTVLDRWLLE